MDVSLIGRDASVFREFYLQYVDDVERFIARRAACAHDVADLMSETFLAAMTAADRFDPRRGEPRAWLLAIAYRKVAAERRRAARAWRAYTREAGLRTLSPDALQALEERFDAEQDVRAVREAWDTLRGSDRELLQLSIIDELAPAEIALILRIPAGAVRVRIHRARNRLRTHFATLCPRTLTSESI